MDKNRMNIALVGQHHGKIDIERVGNVYKTERSNCLRVFLGFSRIKSFQVFLAIHRRVPLIFIRSLYNFEKMLPKGVKFSADLLFNYSQRNMSEFLKERHSRNYGVRRRSNGYVFIIVRNYRKSIFLLIIY